MLGREVVLYWRALAAEARVALPLSLVAAIPGTYTGPASRAYLYYTNEHKHWTDGLRVEIEPIANSPHLADSPVEAASGRCSNVAHADPQRFGSRSVPVRIVLRSQVAGDVLGVGHPQIRVMMLQKPPAGLAVPRKCGRCRQAGGVLRVVRLEVGVIRQALDELDGPRGVDHGGRREGEPAVTRQIRHRRLRAEVACHQRAGDIAVVSREQEPDRRSWKMLGSRTASGRRGTRSERARQNVSATRSESIRSATATSAAHALARSHGLRVGEVPAFPGGPEGVHRLAQQSGRVGRLFRLRQTERAHPEGVPAHHRVDRRRGQPACPGKVDRGHPVRDTNNVLVVLVGFLDHAEHPLGRGGVLAGELVCDVAVVPVELAGVGEALRELQGRVEVDLAELLSERPLGVGGPRGVGQLLGIGLDLAEQGLALLGEAHVEPMLGDLA